MSKEEIIPRIGQSVEAVLHYNGNTRYFKTKVEFVHEDRSLQLSRFLDESIHHLKHLYNEVSLQTVVGGKLFMWDTTFKEHCDRTVTITLVGDAKKCNRRSTFRVPYIAKLKITDIAESEYNITTTDISQTGVGLISFKKLDITDEYILTLDDTFCNTERRVKFVREERGADYYKYGAMFLDDMDFCKRIFDLQRTAMKRNHES